MQAVEALRVLAELSASQWGMVTTAQAAERGVQRLDLSRLAKAGHLERLAHGVYRDAGAPADEFEGLRVAWLAADPSRTAERRLRTVADGVVVMGESAASLHEVGDLPADRHELSSPARRQSQRPEIRYRQRRLEPADVTIANGLPVTTIERTIADLVEARTDLSLVADVLRDAVRARRLDTDRLTELLGALGTRSGVRKGDGAALLARLTALAGLDAASLAEGIAATEALGPLVAANSLARFAHAELTETAIDPAVEQALRGLSDSIARSVAHAISPAMETFAASIGDVPPPPGVEAALAELAERVARNLPTRDLLGSFGERWAATLTSTGGPGPDALAALDVITAAEGARVGGTHG